MAPLRKSAKLTVPKRSKEEVWYTRKLVQAWHESPMYFEALRNAKIAPNQYKCKKCEKVFLLREVQVDHIFPKVDPAVGWVDCATYAARLNCPASGLQVLCADTCHKDKTAKENRER